MEQSQRRHPVAVIVVPEHQLLSDRNELAAVRHFEQCERLLFALVDKFFHDRVILFQLCDSLLLVLSAHLLRHGEAFLRVIRKHEFVMWKCYVLILFAAN